VITNSLSAHEQSRRSELRFAFVAGHLNRSAFTALRACLDAGFRPRAVIMSRARPALARPWQRPFVLALYRLKCRFYRCAPLRMLDSVEIFARKHGIPVIAVDTLKTPESERIVAALNLDLFVVGGGWSEKIPLGVLRRPHRGSINVHPSLLPEYRGTSVTRWQVLDGVERSGVTIHYMDEEFDSGEIIAQRFINVAPDQTPQELFQDLADVGAPLLVEVLGAFAAGEPPAPIEREPDPRYDKYCKRWRWKPARLLLDPADPLERLHFQVMAATQESYEYPGPLLRLGDREFIVRRTRLAERRAGDGAAAGRDDSVRVEEGVIRWERPGEANALLITQLQPSGARYYLRRADRPGRWFPEGIELEVSRAPSRDKC